MIDERIERLAIRLGLSAGLLGSVLVGGGTLVAAVTYRGRQGEAYSPLDHWVSELGEVAVSERSDAFNAGLILGGLCLIGFMLTVGHLARGPFGVAGTVIGVIAAVGGSLVGVFPMDDLERHSWAALTFFGLGWLAVLLLTVALRRAGLAGRALTVLGLAVAVCFWAFLAVLFTGGVDADDVLASPSTREAISLVTTLEWLVVLGVIAWVAVTAVALLRVVGWRDRR